MLLSRDLLYGDRSADQLLIRPIYRPLRVPVRPITQQRAAVGLIGSDFAQVYFPAQNVSRLQDAYDARLTLDPWKRPSRYAPLVILACAATLCHFDFGLACFLEMLFQLLLFYGILYWVCRKMEIQGYFLASLLFINACLFLTPVGVSWFERGQFSLYLAGGYILLVLGLIRRSPTLLAAAAVLAFIKWTSFPAAFVILVVYLLGSRNLTELRSNVLLVSVFGGVIAALLVVPALFTAGADVFVRGLLTQEMEDLPKGVSLLRYVPRMAVKLLPLALIVLGWIDLRREKDQQAWLVPYAGGAVAILLIYPTRAYEYGLPSLLGFLPLLLWWARQADALWIGPRMVFLYTLVLFVVIAAFSTRLVPSLFLLVQFYAGFSLLLLLAPFLLRLVERFFPRYALPAEGS